MCLVTTSHHASVFVYGWSPPCWNVAALLFGTLRIVSPSGFLVCFDLFVSCSTGPRCGAERTEFGSGVMSTHSDVRCSHVATTKPWHYWCAAGPQKTTAAMASDCLAAITGGHSIGPCCSPLFWHVHLLPCCVCLTDARIWEWPQCFRCNPK